MPASSAPEQRESVALSVYAGIFLSSLGVLMLQILLTRIFSFTIWYHLAYLTISTALLGFGAAGTLLAAYPSLCENGVNRLCSIASATAGVTALISIVILGRNPLEPGTMLNSPLLFSLGLFGYYVAVAVPFLAAGISIAAPLTAYPSRVNRLYALDLLGAGMGCVAAILVLKYMSAPAAIAVCAAVFLLAGGVYAAERKLRRVCAAIGLVIVALTPFADRLIELEPSRSKSLAQVWHARELIMYTRWSPINRIDVHRFGAHKFSFWSVKGLNPEYKGFKPSVLAIQYDGHNGSNIFLADDLDDMRMLDYHLLRSPYIVLKEPNVLVIGVGGGIDILNALRNDAKSVTGVELQPLTLYVHNTITKQWQGGLFHGPKVKLVAAEGRHYVRANDDRYDLIQITTTDTFSAQATGAYVLAESYLYTSDAFTDYLDHLTDDGLVSLVVGDVLYQDEDMPAALSTRLILNARVALEQLGVEDPSEHIVLIGQSDFVRQAVEGREVNKRAIGGSLTGNVLVRKTPFLPEEVERLERFAADNGFVILTAPGRLIDNPTSKLLRTASADLEASLARQTLSVHPQTDDAPFFYHVLRWKSVFTGERISWFFPGSTTGQIVLIVMLAQAIVLGALLILYPLYRTARNDISRAHALVYMPYFLSLGVGFMFFEISFVQKYVLFLGFPTYSLSVTLLALLVSAGIGASVSPFGWKFPRLFLFFLLAATMAIGAIELTVMPGVRHSFLGAPFPARAALTVAFQAPTGFILGMYFTTGIEILRKKSPRLVPWAWAVNGVGSVASTVLAVILAMSIGFSGVTYVAMGVYAVGTLSLILVVTFDSGPREDASA